MTEEEKKLQEVAKTLPKELPKVSVFEGMPEYLKDPNNFEQIYKTIYEAGNSRCSHSDVLEYSVCKKCEGARTKRVLTMRKLGFRNGQQYLAWLRTHQNLRVYHKDELAKIKRGK
jgi:hypothetical protein